MLFQPFFLIFNFFAYDTFFLKIHTGQTDRPKQFFFRPKWAEMSKLPWVWVLFGGSLCPKIDSTFSNFLKENWKTLSHQHFSKNQYYWFFSLLESTSVASREYNFILRIELSVCPCHASLILSDYSYIPFIDMVCIKLYHRRIRTFIQTSSPEGLDQRA